MYVCMYVCMYVYLSCVKVKSVHNILCINCNMYRNIVPEGKKKVNLTFQSTKDVHVKSAHTSQALIATVKRFSHINFDMFPIFLTFQLQISQTSDISK